MVLCCCWWRLTVAHSVRVCQQFKCVYDCCVYACMYIYICKCFVNEWNVYTIRCCCCFFKCALYDCMYIPYTHLLSSHKNTYAQTYKYTQLCLARGIVGWHHFVASPKMCVSEPNSTSSSNASSIEGRHRCVVCCVCVFFPVRNARA